MPRTKYKLIIRDDNGPVFINARVYPRLVGTAIALSDAYPTATGGIAAESFVTNAQGEAEFWTDAFREDIDVHVTDNAGAAFPPGGLAGTFPAYTETVQVPAPTGTLVRPSDLADFAPTDVGALGPVASDTIFDTATFDGFGTIVQSNKGKLFIFYSQANGDGGTNGIIKVKTSVDGGVTWTAAATVVAYSVASASHTTVTAGVTATGRIVLSYTDYNAGTGTTTAIKTIYSDDEGTTWSAAVTLNIQGQVFAIPFGRIQVLDEDKVMLSWYGSNGASGGGTLWNSYVAISTDNGATFATNVTVVSSAADQLSESTFVYLGGRSIVGLVRVNNGTTWKQVRSTDNGATWASLGNVAFPGVLSNSDMAADLSLLRDASGVPWVICYWKATNVIKSIVGRASAVFAATSGWDSSTIRTVSTVGSRGYPVFWHRNGQPHGIGWAMREQSATDADIVLLTFDANLVNRFAPAASLNQKAFKIRRESGNLTINSVVYAQIAGFEGILKADVGEWVEVGCLGQWGAEAQDGYLDAVSVYAGVPASSWGSGDAFSEELGGAVEAWRGAPSRQAAFGGSTIKQINASDISADGLVRIQLRARTYTATNKTLFAAGANQLTFWAINHG